MRDNSVPTVRRTIATLRQRLGFCALFLSLLALLALAFDRGEHLFSALYLYPVSWLAAVLLGLIGVPTTLEVSPVELGTCVLTMARMVFHVKEECTGIYALFVYLAAVAAYPATITRKVQGMLVGIPCFFGYSALRLVLLGLIAEVAPDWIRFCHIYLLVLMNLGFTLFLLASWVNRAAAGHPDG